MKPIAKIAVVCLGFFVAIVAASVALEIRLAHTQGPDANASAGMYAFGDGLLFIAVFSVVCVVPIGLGLFFLRPWRRFWTGLSIALLVVGLTGVAGTGLFILAAHHAADGSPLQLFAALWVLRLLGSPLLAGGFFLATVLAPAAPSRRILLAATVLEGLVALYTGHTFFWPVPQP
jgi:hypothetical protein